MEPAPLRILEIEDQASEPWKNGGGITRTLAYDRDNVPPLWRISAAEITRSGDFSRFENTERLSVLLRGPGLQLQCAGTTHVLDRIGSWLRYQGGDFTKAVLGPEPARFLNAMVSQGRARIAAYANPLKLDVQPQSLAVVVVAQGAVLLPAEEKTLQQGQYVLLDSKSPPISLQATAPDAIWVAVVVSW